MLEGCCPTLTSGQSWWKAESLHAHWHWCCVPMSPLAVPVSSSVGTRSYCRWLDAQSAMCPPRMCSSRLYTHRSSPLGRPVSLLCPRSSWALCVRKTWNVEQDRQNGITTWPYMFLICLLCRGCHVALSKKALNIEHARFPLVKHMNWNLTVDQLIFYCSNSQLLTDIKLRQGCTYL